MANLSRTLDFQLTNDEKAGRKFNKGVKGHGSAGFQRVLSLWISTMTDNGMNFRLRRATASILLLGSLTVNESPMHRKPLVLLGALPKPLFRHKAASCNRPGFVLSKQPRLEMDGKLFSRTCFHRAASVFFCKELTYAKLSKTPTKELKEMANLSRTLDFQLTNDEKAGRKFNKGVKGHGSAGFQRVLSLWISTMTDNGMSQPTWTFQNFRLRRATASILLLGSLTVNESPMHRKPLVLLGALPKPLFRHKAASCNRPVVAIYHGERKKTVDIHSL
ncbi:unnamed protein product [Clavelina lepadiformis]